MPSRIPLEGRKINEWTVLEYVGDKKYKCACNCGKIKIVLAKSLQNGSSTSCGCSTRTKLEGKTIGEWTVMKYIGDKYYNCKCSCGVIKPIRRDHLVNGRTTSCGHNSRVKLEGTKVGEWEVLEYLGNQLYKCKCSCGKISEIRSEGLIRGNTTSCGHSVRNNLEGMTFGAWTVLQYMGNRYYKCKCECGEIQEVYARNLLNGTTNSCGCKKIELLQKSQRLNRGGKLLNQEHRSHEQIEMTSSKEHLLQAILKNFDTKPTGRQLAKLVGLQLHRTLTYVHNYELENFVDISSKRSHYEDELRQLFNTPNINDRNALEGYEIDLYYPEHKLAVEFNGDYWHSEVYKKANYHFEKTKAAALKGIDIIHIFEYEWKDEITKNKLIELIKNRLKLNTPLRVYGRDCQIKELTENESKEFLEKYHLQGNAPSKIRLGIFKENLLLGTMTFGTPRFNNNCDYELIRLAWHPNYQVIGGSKKLFKHFVTKYNPNNVISYCDISKFNGLIYFQLGFKIHEVTKPNYKWINLNQDGTMITRYQTQKHKLVLQGLGKEDQTEAEIMHNLGFLRVYDCGNAKFIWQNSKVVG